jgi:hypothetical protein
MWVRLEEKTRGDLKNSLDKLDDLNYVVEAMIASEACPEFVHATSSIE